MGIANIPKNQQDAFPLTTVSDALGGDVIVVGGAVSRFWSGAVLGINGVRTAVNPVDAGHTMLVTPFLDLRGVTTFQFVLTRAVVNGADDLNIGFSLIAQYRSATYTPTLDPSLVSGLYFTIQNFGVTTSPGGYPWTYVTGKNLAFGQFLGPSPGIFSFMGTAVRFWFDRLTAVRPVTETFYLELWGVT